VSIFSWIPFQESNSYLTYCPVFEIHNKQGVCGSMGAEVTKNLAAGLLCLENCSNALVV
jgi:hypothetical protein